MDELERERDNLRAALRRSIQPGGDPELGLRLAIALTYFWRVRGYLSEGQSWLEAALAAGNERIDPTLRARALYCVGYLRYTRSDFLGALEPLRAANAACAALGDRTGFAWSALLLASCEFPLGLEQADEHVQKALDLYGELHDDWGLGLTLYMQSWVIGERGDAARSRAVCAEAVRLMDHVGDPFWCARSKLYLARMQSPTDISGALELAVGTRQAWRGWISGSLADGPGAYC
jgi:hypothetical protein